MGIWGTGIFENDVALDWVEQLLQSNNTSLLREAIRGVVDTSRYLEAPECCIALAAVEIVAALKNKEYSLLPEAVESWVRKNSFIIDTQLVEVALRTIQAISRESELRDLWSESSFHDEWSNVINSLEQRLRSPNI